MFSTIEKELTKQTGIDSTKINDSHVLQYLWAVVCKFRQRNQRSTIECILCEEKLLHIAIIIIQKQPDTKLPFSISDEVTGFVQKINQTTMEGIKEEQNAGNTRLIAKAVDILMLADLQKHYASDEPQVLCKLKILTFNNLACILKRNRHLMMALRAVSFAVQLEEELVRNYRDQEKYDIVPTYLNKAAVLSDLGKHDRALQQIWRARGYVEKIDKSVEKALQECSQVNLKQRLQQKRHYGQYMKMLISYNTGAQKEHQKLLSSAVTHYQERRRSVIAIDNQLMARKLEEIILKIKASPR